MSASNDRLRVLVVDDEESILKVLSALLQHRGDDYATASSGMEALSLIEQRDFDILITDLYMPVMNGLELIRRAQAVRPEIVAMILTGLGTTHDTIAAIKQGVYDYIEKPLRDLQSFSLVIDRAGARARLVRERNRLMADLQRQNERLEASLHSLNQAYDRLLRQEERLVADLRQAQRMQQSLLPARFPHVPGLDFYGFYNPCEALGGDFFGLIPLRDGRVAVYLADVAGHGVRAAMVTVIVRELIHAERMLHPEGHVFEHPATALAFLNQALREEEMDDPLHVTMAYAVADGATGTLLYGGAGHPRPILTRAGQPGESLRAEGPALGMERQPVFHTVSAQLNAGDSLLLFSDGISEARNRAGEELSASRLARVCACGRILPLRELGERLERELLVHRQDAPASDDATFLLMGRTAPAGAREDQPAPPAVRILNPGEVHAAAPDGGAIVESGWVNGACVIRIAGRATWQVGATLRARVRQADEQGAAAIYLDLKDCESLDSTLLGLINQFASRVVLCAPSDKAVRSLRELGILPRATVVSHPPPEAVLARDTPAELDKEEKAEMILAAHESLLRLSEENVKKFGAVVEALRRDQAARG